MIKISSLLHPVLFIISAFPHVSQAESPSFGSFINGLFTTSIDSSITKLINEAEASTDSLTPTDLDEIDQLARARLVTYGRYTPDEVSEELARRINEVLDKFAGAPDERDELKKKLIPLYLAFGKKLSTMEMRSEAPLDGTLS